jgi:hypothetical protein
MKVVEIDSESLKSVRVVVSPDQVCSDLDGEAVILDLKSGGYYGLNSVGARIWQLIQQPQRVAEIRSVLLEEYDVDTDTCDRELKALLESLQNAGLIQVQHENTV